jgi:hypothetical protein
MWLDRQFWGTMGIVLTRRNLKKCAKVIAAVFWDPNPIDHHNAILAPKHDRLVMGLTAFRALGYGGDGTVRLAAVSASNLWMCA